MAFEPIPDDPSTEEPITIYPNKRLLVALAFISLVSVILCLLIFLPSGNHSTQDMIMAAVGTLLFGVGFLLFTSIIYRWNQPSIVISSEGLLDRFSPFSVGMIRWNEIESVKRREIRFIPYIRIYVTDIDLDLEQNYGSLLSEIRSQVSRED